MPPAFAAQKGPSQPVTLPQIIGWLETTGAPLGGVPAARSFQLYAGDPFHVGLLDRVALRAQVDAPLARAQGKSFSPEDALVIKTIPDWTRLALSAPFPVPRG